MPLEAHWSRQHSPLGARERRVALALLAALALCAVVVALVASRGGSTSGCVDATIASTTGGAAVHACGERARQLCAAPGQGREIRTACRRAGYRFSAALIPAGTSRNTALTSLRSACASRSQARQILLGHL